MSACYVQEAVIRLGARQKKGVSEQHRLENIPLLGGRASWRR